jgi:hypothetical protein
VPRKRHKNCSRPRERARGLACDHSFYRGYPTPSRKMYSPYQ